MTRKRLVTVPRVLVALLVVGLAAFAIYLIQFPADQHDRTESEEKNLEALLEEVPGVSSAGAHVSAGSVSVSLDLAVDSEQQYLDLIDDASSVWAASPLAARKSLSLSVSVSGQSEDDAMQFRNVDVDELDEVVAAARIAYRFGPEDVAMLGGDSAACVLIGNELRMTLLVADESSVAPTLARLIAEVDESGLVYREGGLRVEVVP